MVPLSSATPVPPAVQTLPVALVYWSDIPARFTVVVPRLCSSMKSFLYWAPELPPPPYTWLMTSDPSQRFGLVVENPVGCVNCAGMETPTGFAAAVVTRILYVRFTSRPG